MRFDDRLTTVLSLTAYAPRDRAVQWRQLVELVARGAGEATPALLKGALDRIAALSTEVPDNVRAAAARAIAGHNPPLALVALFVDRTETAAPLLATVTFDQAQWNELRDKAAPDVQRLMDSLRPACGQQADGEQGEEPSSPGLERAARAALPLPEASEPPPALFRWECGPTGEIDWVEGAPRAALIGRSLADDFHQRFAARLPFSDESLVLAEEGTLAGEWKWSGTPTFFPDTGRFAGYSGSARRGELAGAGFAAVAAAQEAQLEGNRLRELIHELRTPLTAIIGFGEIIEGQILGPAHRAYRNRAAEIVRQARRLLAAVDDLDLAAKLQSSRTQTSEASPAGELLTSVMTLLGPQFEGRLKVHGAPDGGGMQIKLQKELAERLVRRFIEAIANAAGNSETLILAVGRAVSQVGIALSRPFALEGLDDEQLLDPGFTTDDQKGLGTGFALRLVRGLATIAGGGLDITPEAIVLRLPGGNA